MLKPRELFPQKPWPIKLAMKLGFHESCFDTIEVYDSTTSMTFGEAVWLDDWTLADGSFPHHHWAVEIIMDFSHECRVHYDEETNFDDEDHVNIELRVIRIDIAAVPVIM